jgi:hypothetical protein
MIFGCKHHQSRKKYAHEEILTPPWLRKYTGVLLEPMILAVEMGDGNFKAFVV